MALIIFFAAIGAVLGLFFGLICGVALFAITRASYYPSVVNPERFRAVAGRVCVAASALLLLLDRLLYGDFFNPAGSYLSRALGGDPDFYSRGPRELTVFGSVVLVVVPLVMFPLVMWWAGRMVAARYTGEAGDTAVMYEVVMALFGIAVFGIPIALYSLLWLLHLLGIYQRP